MIFPMQYLFFNTFLNKSPNFFHGTADPSGPEPPARTVSPTHSPLADNIKNSQQTDTRTPGRTRTCNPKKRVAGDQIPK